MRNEMMRGELVSRDYVEKFSIAFFQRYKELITQLPSDLAVASGVPEQSAKELELIANRLVDRVILEMTYELEKKKEKLRTANGLRPSR